MLNTNYVAALCWGLGIHSSYLNLLTTLWRFLILVSTEVIDSVNTYEVQRQLLFTLILLVGKLDTFKEEKKKIVKKSQYWSVGK